MNDLFKIFGILLLVLILISSFGGGLRLREPFEDESNINSELKAAMEAAAATAASTATVANSAAASAAAASAASAPNAAASAAATPNAAAPAATAPSAAAPKKDDDVPMEMRLLAQKMLADASMDTQPVYSPPQDMQEVEGFEGGCVYAGCM